MGHTSAHHMHVKFTEINVIKKHGSKTGIATDRNGINKKPHCKDLFAVKVTAGLTPTMSCGHTLWEQTPLIQCVTAFGFDTL